MSAYLKYPFWLFKSSVYTLHLYKLSFMDSFDKYSVTQGLLGLDKAL